MRQHAASLRSEPSGGEPGGRSERKRARTRGTGRVAGRCVSGSDGSTRRIWRTSIRIPAICSGRASHLEEGKNKNRALIKCLHNNKQKNNNNKARQWTRAHRCVFSCGRPCGSSCCRSCRSPGAHTCRWWGPSWPGDWLSAWSSLLRLCRGC